MKRILKGSAVFYCLLSLIYAIFWDNGMDICGCMIVAATGPAMLVWVFKGVESW